MLDDNNVLQEVKPKGSDMEQPSISGDVGNIGEQELIRNSKMADVAKIQFLPQKGSPAKTPKCSVRHPNANQKIARKRKVIPKLQRNTQAKIIEDKPKWKKHEKLSTMRHQDVEETLAESHSELTNMLPK